MCVTASRVKNRINVCLDGINNMQVQKKATGSSNEGWRFIVRCFYNTSL